MGGNRARRSALIGGTAVAVVLAVVAVLLVRGGGEDDDRAERAAEEAEAFLDAWSAGDLEAAAGLTDDPEAAASLLDSVRSNMRAESVAFEVSGEPADTDGEAAEGAEDALTVPFTATFTLPGVGEWAYDSAAVMIPAGGDGGEEWTVRWGSDLVHPELAEGQTLVLSVEEAERAPVLAADDSVLAGPSPVWDISVWPARLTDPDAAYEALEGLDAGIDTGALADRVEAAEPDQAVPVITLRDTDFQEHADALRAVEGLQFQEGTRTLPHAARSLVGAVDPDTGSGTAGLQERYDEQLAGSPAGAVVIADRESGAAVTTLHEQEGGEPGEPVRTTLDPRVQQAAETALADLGRDGAIVAVQPSTGHVLAAADWPADGFNRALQGQLAPGSTFKVLTAASLIEDGATPDEVLGCPQYVTVDGQRFENQDEFELGPGTTLREAFTSSCNTAFIDNRDRFGHDRMSEVAQAFGIGGAWDVGAATFDGSVPVTETQNQLAASLIGQDRVQASPLVMASVAATVAEGAFRQPVLVPDAVEQRHEAEGALSQDTVEALRSMMRDTVTDGSATALSGVPGVPHGKTGTAEFHAEDGELSTNAWIIGYLAERDLAFAVMLEDGGSGGSDAGPLAADFLNAL
ncbi:penicillin-binding transpeptidase domain-containing protein [Streptomyces marincola]|uniref:Penicillin-binding protein n=1 Tax=Streptomyces marincola TaxID=2878388 RepID=A0A1W7D0C2_9ACTN|nr:penicillin-binding transpeptidase domain-containing protein [Streptomyces marincola]ARQ70417.1 hypothetical protein CAG99_17620 [Streptomyces marincola]